MYKKQPIFSELSDSMPFYLNAMKKQASEHYLPKCADKDKIAFFSTSLMAFL